MQKHQVATILLLFIILLAFMIWKLWLYFRGQTNKNNQTESDYFYHFQISRLRKTLFFRQGIQLLLTAYHLFFTLYFFSKEFSRDSLMIYFLFSVILFSRFLEALAELTFLKSEKKKISVVHHR